MKSWLFLFLLLLGVARAELLATNPRNIAWTADGRHVAACLTDSVAVATVPAGDRLYTLKIVKPASLAFSQDGTRLAVGTVGDGLSLYRVQDGKLLWKTSSGRKPEEAQYSALYPCFLPGGDLITVGTGGGRSSPDEFMRWFDLATGKQLKKQRGGLTTTRDLKHLALIERGRVQILGGRTLEYEEGFSPVGLLEPGSGFVLHRAGPLDGIRHSPGTLRVVDLKTGKTETFEKVPSVVGSAPDGRLILGYGDGLYDLATRQTLATGGWPFEFAGNLALVSDNRSPWKVVDIRSGKVVFTLPSGVAPPALGPGGSRVATVIDERIVVFDTGTGKRLW